MIKIVSLPCGGAFAPARRPAAGGAAGPWAGCGRLSSLVSPCVAQRTAGGAFAVWAVLQRHTGRFAMPNGPFRAAERPVWATRWHSATLRPGRRALCGVAAEVAAGLRCSGRRLASVGRACTAGLGETGVMQGVGAYSGNARLPACIKIMSVGLAVAWRLVAMAASVCPAWNIERRLNIFFPAPCPAFD